MSKLPAYSKLRPPSTRVPQPAAAAAAQPKPPKEPAKPPPPSTTKKLEFTLPAFSVPAPKKKEGVNWEKLRKQSIRRQAPEGENLPELKRVIKDLKGQKLNVTEFVNLVAPYTADNGQCLREIIEEEMKSFRTLAKKVYETMTKDVSDVLANEQMQLREYYDNRCALLNDRMMSFLDEIFCMVPDFDFEKFFQNSDEYFDKILSIPEELKEGDEVVEMHRRQLAYHRLQWLRTEEERLNEENAKLLTKLNHLKIEQKMKQEQAEQIALEAENERQNLVAQETAVKEQLEQLNNSMERTAVRTETAINLSENAEKAKVLQKVEDSKKTTKLKKKQSKGSIKTKRRPDWVSEAASEIEETAKNETLAKEKGAIKRPKSRGSARSPHFSPIKTPPQKAPPKQASPFHYSPPKTPPGSTQQRSPFHFSPIRSPPPQPPKERSPFHYSPPRMDEARALSPQRQVQEVKTTVTERRMPTTRRSLAPRDSWGGF